MYNIYMIEIVIISLILICSTIFLLLLSLSLSLWIWRTNKNIHVLIYVIPNHALECIWKQFISAKIYWLERKQISVQFHKKFIILHTKKWYMTLFQSAFQKDFKVYITLSDLKKKWITFNAYIHIHLSNLSPFFHCFIHFLH